MTKEVLLTTAISVSHALWDSRHSISPRTQKRYFKFRYVSSLIPYFDYIVMRAGNIPGKCQALDGAN